MSDIDTRFKAMADQAEQEEREKASRKGSFHREYEKIKWTGLETSKLKIVRAIGEYPDFHLSEGVINQSTYDARVVRIARVINDKGKQMRLVLPLRDRDDSYIMWRVIDRINEVEWVKDSEGKGMKIFLSKESHPSLFNMINFNNLSESDPKRKFGLLGKGWMGKEYFIMNVIDRSMMNWHRENKHTVLLSKNINIVKGDNGKIAEYVEEGVPAFGFTKALMMNVVKFYGFWENYDIGLERTGLQTTPIRVINAYKHIEEVPSDLQPLVSSNPSLTEEEKSWERYDLNKLFQVTSYTKIYNQLHLSFAKIDNELGTHFLDELKSLHEQEIKERGKNLPDLKPDDEEEILEMNTVAEVIKEQTKIEIPNTVFETAIESSKNKAYKPSGSSVENIIGDPKNLPSYNKLSDKEKSVIVSAVLMNEEEKGVLNSTATPEKPIKPGMYWKIQYSDTIKRKGKCPDCGCISPEFFSTCPNCGASFIY